MDASRRKFLAQSLAIGCSAAASPFVTPVTFASIPSDNRLVVIVLRGAMDGLDICAPLGEPVFKQYRPGLSKRDFRDLDGFFALNENLADLMPLWKAGELGFVQAVSTPYRDKRSHFDGQDLLEAGLAEEGGNVRDSGWINRMLSLIPGAEQDSAFSVGRESMLILRGDFPVTSWAPESRVDMSPHGQMLLDAIYAKDPLFAQAGQTALTLAAQLSMEQMQGDGDEEDAEMMAEMLKSMRSSQEAQQASGLAAFAAERLKEDTRFATFSIGGWDTHLRQDRAIRNASKELQAALLTLHQQLGPVWDKTCVLCMTEFGRTVRENGSGGTDHGTGGAMIMAGGAIKGRKVYGDWPGLEEAALYERRDLMPTADLRRYAGWAAHDLFGLSVGQIENTVFPGVDMATNPGFLR
ncbi:DUF1501 domain-containing protein [Neptunicoccus cionae]|uniref:DUF1501 domain-containing protein n=1 Tax=Neptunicoccus cionae TaxID=2035344 RepID=UPI000C76B019|nr:DUF1501 domain-containing protein [Amylibacter cionae]PLS22455.1 twin-arginine translocation pathway signal [Amylibacter cionae]